MKIKQYGRVLLKDGYEASIVEIFIDNKLFLADLDGDCDTDTDDLTIDEIEKVIY